MKNIILVVFLFNIILSINGQEILFENRVKLGFQKDEINLFGGNVKFNSQYDRSKLTSDKSGFTRRLTLPIIDTEKSTLTLLILGKKESELCSFSKDFQIENLNSFRSPKSKFQNVMGYSQSSENIIVYYRNKKKFIQSKVILNEDTIITAPLNLNLKKEKFLLAFNNGKKFYILTILKFTSILKLYSIEGNENITFDEFDFSGHDFTTEYPYTLFNVFKYEDKPVPIIDNESPNPLDLTTQDFKAYIFDDRLVFTLDDLASGTDIITINLKSKTSDFQKWRNANLKENQFYLTNSYISDKNIYQIFANKDEMNITVKELYSKNIIAQFSANREDDIKFKNTPLKQEGGTSLYTSGKEKELKNNSEFFRKLWNSNIGISVYKSNVLQITFGGYREYTQGMASGSFGTSSSTISTPMGNATAASGYSYNPTFNGFNSYTTSRSMYFVGVFNKDTFEHLDGELQKNVFDKIKAYSKEIKSNISTETIFKFNNYYVFGYYDNSVKKYFMRKFEDDK